MTRRAGFQAADRLQMPEMGLGPEGAAESRVLPGGRGPV